MAKSTVNIIKTDKTTKFLIKIGEKSLFYKIILVLLAIPGFIIPIAVLAFSINYKIEIGFGFLFVIIIGFGTGIYLSRLFLWNTFGTEQIEISQDEIMYCCDYRLFKDRKKKLALKDLSIELSVEDEENLSDSTGVILLKNNSEVIETNIKLSYELLENTIDKLQEEINKYRQQ